MTKGDLFKYLEDVNDDTPITVQTGLFSEEDFREEFISHKIDGQENLVGIHISIFDF